MSVEKTDRDIATLVSQVSSGEIRLPEIQRGYVWKSTQIARLIESLYRGYPSGSLLLWRTFETPETRAIAANAPTVKPAVLPLYLLDGQQRLTSLHRVFTDHPEAQIVFNVETEAFQNQSAATRKDPRWVKVHDLLQPDTDLFEVREQLLDLALQPDSRELGHRINRVAAIPKYRYHMEIITDSRTRSRHTAWSGHSRGSSGSARTDAAHQSRRRGDTHRGHRAGTCRS